jgi:PAS domain S-box-containing protein
MSDHLSEVTSPSIQTLDDFKKMMVRSQMYSTNWVFLRSEKADKDSLVSIHQRSYSELRSLLSNYAAQWTDGNWKDSVLQVYKGFEELMGIEKKIMGSLQSFTDYDDPMKKLEAERIVEDEVLPRTDKLMAKVDAIIQYNTGIRKIQAEKLERARLKLLSFIIFSGIAIILIGFLLSIYLTGLIVAPVRKIRDIINGLGKGVIQKIPLEVKNNEIGEMISSVNNLSEKLRSTANFAREVGNRNFKMPFQALSESDTLSHALISMRDNLRSGEQKLLEANEEIQTIYDAVPDAVIIIDEAGRIVKFDHKAETLFGWKEQEVIRSRMSDKIIPERFREAHNRGMQRFLSSGEGHSLNKALEVIAVKKDGTEFNISLSISSCRINGQYRFVGFVRDITERKKAETKLQGSEERYRQIVETAQEGIWLTDKNNCLTFVNKKMAKMLEYDTAEMIGRHANDFIDAASLAVFLEKSMQRARDTEEQYELLLMSKTGKRVWTHVAANSVFSEDGRFKGSLGMVTDITVRRINEKLLRESEADLDIKNKELALKNKELEQFAYVASHDMQEPLRTTSSFVELLQKQYKGRLDEKADKYLSYIEQSSERMKVLINDLLDYSRLGKKQDMAKLDCNSLLEFVIADLDLAIAETNTVITAATLPVLDIYPTEFKLLLQNLIMNAIKFRKKDTSPRIGINATAYAGYWQFSVSDNGIGIDSQYKERVFIIFQRLHNRNEYEGSGIGLAHCKKIVALHGGKIWIESEPGIGTTMYFTIPIKNTHEKEIKMHTADR